MSVFTMFLVCFLYEWVVKVFFSALFSTILEHSAGARRMCVRFLKWAKKKGYYEEKK